MSELVPTRTEHEPTATERLRALLDERGVEWMPIAWNPERETFYHTSNGVGFCADEYADGVKIYTDATITPEQAIAATLGVTDATGARQGDAVEVVRCRDCAHAVVSRPFYTFAGRPADIEVWRCDYFWNVDEPPEVEPDGFCAWGKRRESE